MNTATRFAASAVLALTLGGCASDGHEASMAVTHEWVATDRVAQVRFDANERECSERSAVSVERYEECMIARGYEPFEP